MTTPAKKWVVAAISPMLRARKGSARSRCFDRIFDASGGPPGGGAPPGGFVPDVAPGAAGGGGSAPPGGGGYCAGGGAPPPGGGGSAPPGGGGYCTGRGAALGGGGSAPFGVGYAAIPPKKLGTPSAACALRHASEFRSAVFERGRPPPGGGIRAGGTGGAAGET